MKRKFFLRALMLWLALLSPMRPALAQETAFSFQGYLQHGGSPAQGSYDFVFDLYSESAGPGKVGVTITNNAVTVSEGLFVVSLDFGASFPGTSRWLEIAARTNGSGAFTTLSPRQQLLPTPYAQTANSALTAANLSGLLPASQLTGTITDSQLSDNVALKAYVDAQLRRADTNQFEVGADNGLHVRAGAVLTNLNVQMFGATGQVEVVFNVKAPPFCAVGDGVADDTAALQRAIDDAAAGLGNSRRVHLPRGCYRITGALNIPPCSALEIYGDGIEMFRPDNSPTRIWQTSPTDADGIHALTDGTVSFKNVWLHDFAVTGRTNWGFGCTNSGVSFFSSISGFYNGAFQFVKVSRLAVSGFCNGYRTRDTVSTRFEQCSAMYNTNAGWILKRADTTALDSCWSGWGMAVMGDVKNDRTTAIDASESGWLTVAGGEFGNCYRVLKADGSVITWSGGNIESIHGTEAILFTNVNYFTSIGLRYGKTAGSTVPVFRCTSNPSGQIWSCISIINPAFDGSTNLVSVEGNYLDLPRVSVQWTAQTWPVIDVRNAVGLDQPIAKRLYWGTVADTAADGQVWPGRPNFMNGIYANAGSLTNRVTSQSANYALTATDSIVLLDGDLTATLPSAVGIPGKTYTIKCSSAGTNGILTTSAQTIDGISTPTPYTNTALNKFVTVVSDGANWQIIGQN